MTFKEFKEQYEENWSSIQPEHIRKGQGLMNFLADIWPAEYRRVSSVYYYDQHDIDCYYKDELIPNTWEHLEKVWTNFPN